MPCDLSEDPPSTNDHPPLQGVAPYRRHDYLRERPHCSQATRRRLLFGHALQQSVTLDAHRCHDEPRVLDNEPDIDGLRARAHESKLARNGFDRAAPDALRTSLPKSSSSRPPRRRVAREQVTTGSRHICPPSMDYIRETEAVTPSWSPSERWQPRSVEGSAPLSRAYHTIPLPSMHA